MVLRLAWDEQYYTQDDFLLWYGRERGFEIWEEAGNVETLPTLCRRLIPGGRRPREPRANIALGLAGFDARPPP